MFYTAQLYSRFHLSALTLDVTSFSNKPFSVMVVGKANPTATAGQPGFEYMRDMASIMAGQLIGFWRWLIG